MRQFALAIAVGALVAGTAAQAQVAGSISNIQGSATTTVSLPGFDNFNFGAGAGTQLGSSAPSGASYNSFVNVGQSAITFESANAGALANTSSTSTVSFNVTNNTGHAVNFNSTITAAGLGFYLADTSGGCLYSCPQAVGHTFSELGGSTLVGFSFSVTSSGAPASGPQTLYTLTGELGVNADGLTRELGTSGDGPNDPPTGAAALKNFGTTLGDDFDGNVNDIGDASAIGYAWDATNISFDIGSLTNQTLTYTTTVFSESSSDCIANTSICLVAYSGFGDPVGRGGDVTDFASAFGLGLASDESGDLIGGLNFAPSTFNLPTFDGNGVNFQAGVPEPATWAMMIAGFGLLGAALRRRRVLAYN